MRTNIARIGVIGTLVAASVMGAGCNKGETVPVKPLPAPNQMNSLNKKQGGGVDDMTVYPAPTGVKTGLEGGKK